MKCACLFGVKVMMTQRSRVFTAAMRVAASNFRQQ